MKLDEMRVKKSIHNDNIRFAKYIASIVDGTLPNPDRPTVNVINFAKDRHHIRRRMEHNKGVIKLKAELGTPLSEAPSEDKGLIVKQKETRYIGQVFWRVGRRLIVVDVYDPQDEFSTVSIYHEIE